MTLNWMINSYEKVHARTHAHTHTHSYSQEKDDIK